MSLSKLVDGKWVLINESITNSDGRCAEFLQREAFRSGRYKLYFGVEKYFKSIRTPTIYPFIEVNHIQTFLFESKTNSIFLFKKN